MKRLSFELRADKVEGGGVTLRVRYVDERGELVPSTTFGEGKTFHLVAGDCLTLGPLNAVDHFDAVEAVQ